MKKITLLLILSCVAVVNAETPEAPDENADEPTLFERLLVTPRRDAWSESDRKRQKLERSLPELTAEPPPLSAWEEFLLSIANADVANASPAQVKMTEKLNDPDFNRLPH